MSQNGGARPGAGRPKGSTNTATVAMVAEAAKRGVTPVEYMLGILHDPNADEKAKAWAAEKAAPYVHPRPAPVQRTVTIDLPAADTAAGVKDAFAALIAAVGRGDLSPGEAQSVASLIEGQRKAIETADILARVEALEVARGDAAVR